MLENPLPAASSTATNAAAAAAPQVPLAIDVAAIPESAFAFARFTEQVGDVLSRGLPLSVAVAGLDQQQDAADCLRRVTAVIAECAGRYAVSPGAVEIVIAAHAMLPAEAWTIRRDELGRGPLYLLAGEHELRVRPELRPRFRRFWQQLWRLQTDRQLRLACAPLVRSSCPLLAHEAGRTVLPGSALQVPYGSAWVRQDLDLCRYADANGVLDRARLRAGLQRSIDTAIAIHEQTDWPSASLRHDSWLNRRQAIFISGIGDLVLRRRQDPRELGCLASLRKTMRWIRDTLMQRSKQLAASGDVLPAIGQFDLANTLGAHRERWQARWSVAISEHASACRHHFVMSPWSVFPTRVDPDPVYLNLLPLLDFADAGAFPEPPPLHGWNINNFMQLHQRAWAVLERRDEAQRIAERV